MPYPLFANSEMMAWLSESWVVLVAAGGFLLEFGCGIHAVLNKRDTRSAILWVGLIYLTPLIGAVLYILFGVNRIERKAKRLRSRKSYQRTFYKESRVPAEPSGENLPAAARHLESLVPLLDTLTEQPLLEGNNCRPLWGGKLAYAEMLAAIGDARDSINLCTYIFDNDLLGKQFIAALAAAVQRGVAVRVLIDDVGSRYSWPTVVGPLRAAGVQVECFMRTFLPTRFAYSNLRLHRKIMVIDGQTGFTGGMNIRAGTCGEDPHRCAPLEDLHFLCAGPVVGQLQEAFAEDWYFTTQEILDNERWFPEISPAGKMLARGAPSGPDEDRGELRTTLVAAITLAKQRIVIMTPYFLPDDTLIEALHVAVLRGVRVDIILPATNNLQLVQWACQGTLPLVLERDCRVWKTPGIFDHSKLLVVDGVWTLFGSANWDPRSLRLNFEFNVECYDETLVRELLVHADRRIAGAVRITRDALHRRQWLIKLRDGVARLFSPML
ncbi:MAG: cardiolipin synthase [Pirellulales bacterium]|nr:cardiolipin synthase [Pirellulales bacterium]